MATCPLFVSSDRGRWASGRGGQGLVVKDAMNYTKMTVGSMPELETVSAQPAAVTKPPPAHVDICLVEYGNYGGTFGGKFRVR